MERRLVGFLLDFILPFAQFFGLGYLFLHAPEVVKFDGLGFGLMLLADAVGLSILATCIYLLSKTESNEAEEDSFLEGLSRADTARMLFAGTEDVVFIAPLLFLSGTNLYWGLALSCCAFAYLHYEYPVRARLFKMLYILVSYGFAARFGLLTTIAAHGVKDALAAQAGKLLLHYTNKPHPEPELEEEHHVSIH